MPPKVALLFMSPPWLYLMYAESTPWSTECFLRRPVLNSANRFFFIATFSFSTFCSASASSASSSSSARNRLISSEPRPEPLSSLAPRDVECLNRPPPPAKAGMVAKGRGGGPLW